MTKKLISTNGMLRRINLCYMTPSEILIQQAIWEIEKLGADLRLTNAQILLGQAKDIISEIIDERIIENKSE